MEKYRQGEKNTMQILSNFNDTLREFLTEKEMTPRMFAKQAGFPESAVYYWLDRTYVPSTANLLRFADFCDVSLDYLLGLSETRSFRRAAQPVPFAERFRTLLQQTGKSQYAAAKHCGIGCSAVSKWLHRGKLPRADTLVKLADFFNCSMDYLLGRTDIP